MRRIILATIALAFIAALSACNRKVWIGAPGPPTAINAEVALGDALAQAQAEDKVVFVHLTEPG